MNTDKEGWPEVIEIPLGKEVRPLRFVRILAGGEVDTFRMGQRGGESKEEPVHEVILVGPFYLAEVPVMQGQFEVWTGTEDSQRWFRENEELIKRTSWNSGAEEHIHESIENPDHPAEQVTWWGAAIWGVAWGGWTFALSGSRRDSPDGRAE